MGTVLGLAAKIYYGDSVADDDWTLLANVQDVTINLEKGEADVTTRAAEGWEQTVGTLKSASIDFTMIYDTADDGFTAIQEAFMGNWAIGIAAMDGDIDTPGSQGLWADCAVTSLSNPQPLREALTVSVTLKPTRSATPPAWVTVKSS